MNHPIPLRSRLAASFVTVFLPSILFAQNYQAVGSWGGPGGGGGSFNSPAGTAVDRSGNIYVADVMNHRVQKFSQDGTFLTMWGIYGSSSGQMEIPNAVAVDSIGNVYVADPYHYSGVQKFSSDGAFVGELPAVGNSVAVGKDRFVYVVRDTVYKFSPQGLLVSKFGRSGNSIAVDDSNYVYVVAQREIAVGQDSLVIYRYRSDGVLVNNFSRGPLCCRWWPIHFGVAVDSARTIYVCSPYEGMILKYTVTGGNLGQFTSQSGQGIAITPTGTIVIAGTTGSSIQVVTKQGALVRTFGQFGGMGDGHFNFPHGMAIDTARGYAYVADFWDSRIQRLSLDGAFQRKWGSSGTLNGQFTNPEGIAVDKSGNVYVNDAGMCRVQKFDSVGTFLRSWGRQGSGQGEFQRNSAIAVDKDNFVYVTDGNNQVQKFTSDGTFVLRWGTTGSGDGQFLAPRGITIDAQGYVYVVDHGTYNERSRVQKFTSSGAFVAKWNLGTNGWDGTPRLAGMSVDKYGNLYLADDGENKAYRFTPDGSLLAKWDCADPAGLGVDGSGSVYVVSGQGGGSKVTKYRVLGVNYVLPSLPGELVPDSTTLMLLHMNELAGASVNDATINGNNGTAVGTSVVDGKVSKARSFNGVTDYVGVADKPELRLQGDFTVEAWIYRTSAASKYHPIMVKGTGSLNGWGMFIHTSDRFHFSSMGRVDYIGNRIINVNEWTHVAAVCNGAALNLYVNGSLDRSFSFVRPPLATDSLYIARDRSLSTNFAGRVDEVRISNKARSPEEFNLQLPPKYLVAEVAGTTINLRWQNGGGAVSLLRYRIYRGSDSTNVALLDSTTVSTYANTGLATGRNYHYRISAVDSTGFEGGKSYATSCSVPLPPSPSLNCVSPATSNKGSDFILELGIGDSSRTASLFGLGFDLNFTNTAFVDFVSADTSRCFLGASLLYILNPDDANGKVSIGLSRKAPASGVTGGGTVIKLKFHVATDAPDNAKIVFSVSSISASDPNGTSIALFPVSDTTTIAPNLNVWPGDADNSGVVNQNDVLPMGLYWAKTGFARSGASTQWLAQSAIPWTPSAATFADANGDGIVNQADVLPIGLNWAKTHSLNKTEILIVNSQGPTPAGVLGTPVLRASGPASVRGKTMFDVTVTLGDTVNPVAGLFGLSFVLEFASSKSVIQATEVTPGTFLGSDIIFFPQIDNNTGQVALGMTRKNGVNDVAGFGQVAKIKFQVVNNTSSSSFAFTTRDIIANDAGGNPVAVQPSSSSILVSASEMQPIPRGFRLEQNYPNPFNPSTRIAFSVPRTTMVQLRILDALGREVALLVSGERPAGVYDIQWEAGNMPSGIYFYRLQAGDASTGSARVFVETKKMILLR